MITLYELTNEYKALLLMAEDPEVDPETIADTMEALEGELEVKAESYVVIIKELTAEAEKFKAESERLTKRKDTLELRIAQLKDRLIESMKETGRDKLPTEHFKLSIAKNGGVQPLKITGDVPKEYCKLEPDNKKIRESLLLGEKLDFAQLEDRGVHLSIR